MYTEDVKRKYKSILLATNAHRRNYTKHSHLRSNREYKYRYVIAPLLKDESKMIIARYDIKWRNWLRENDYVHRDDPNELVDRMLLLEASRQAGHNAQRDAVNHRGISWDWYLYIIIN